MYQHARAAGSCASGRRKPRESRARITRENHTRESRASRRESDSRGRLSLLHGPQTWDCSQATPHRENTFQCCCSLRLSTTRTTDEWSVATVALSTLATFILSWNQSIQWPWYHNNQWRFLTPIKFFASGANCNYSFHFHANQTHFHKRLSTRPRFETEAKVRLGNGLFNNNNNNNYSYVVYWTSEFADVYANRTNVHSKVLISWNFILKNKKLC